MKKKDLNEIAKIEKAIREKYGDEAIQNPKRHWDEEKEIKYLEDLKAFYKPTPNNKKTKEEEGFLITHSKPLPEDARNCPTCGSYSFSSRDDLYMTKFDCCFDCYVQYVEGRQERWKSGWRPNN